MSPALAPQITVDGDTSTNDTVLGLASGAAGGALISDPHSPEAAQLEAAVTALLQVQPHMQYELVKIRSYPT